MKHNMKLLKKPFDAIESGNKTIEIRLNDEKRRKVKVGDVIEFSKLPDLNEKIQVKVLELLKYDSFAEMYIDFWRKYFACEDLTIEEMLESTYTIYTKEQEKKLGVLGIRIQLI